MKKEYIWGIVWGFIGFFLTDLVGIHHPIAKTAVVIVGAIIIVIILNKNKEKGSQ